MSSSPERSIGLVTWDFDPPRGGLGRAMQMLAAALLELGHPIHILSPKGHPILRWTQFPGGQIFFSLLLPFILSRWMLKHRISCVLFPVGPGGVFLSNDCRTAPAARSTCSELREASRCRAIAIVYHTYAQQAQCVPGERWKRLFVPLEQRALDRADAILCYSADTAEHLRNRGITPGKIRFLPQIFDARAWIPPAPVPKIPDRCIAVMRLDRRKGLDVLLCAWPLIRQAVPSATLRLVGKGRGESRVRRLLMSDSSVLWSRKLSPDDLLQSVAGAEIALCPSFLEGFGLACAEAMAAGTAVVASDAPGLRSLVRDRETGMLVLPGDDRALADSVVHLLSDAALRERLAISARQDILRRSDPARAREALAGVLESVCFPSWTR